MRRTNARRRLHDGVSTELICQKIRRKQKKRPGADGDQNGGVEYFCNCDEVLFRICVLTLQRRCPGRSDQQLQMDNNDGSNNTIMIMGDDAESLTMGFLNRDAGGRRF